MMQEPTTYSQDEVDEAIEYSERAAYNRALEKVTEHMELLVDYLKENTSAERQIMWQEFLSLLTHQLTHVLRDRE